MDTRSDGAHEEDRYLVFTVDGHEYGLRIDHVREILQMRPVTPIPKLPPHIKGVTLLRDRTIPVIDLRIRLGLPAAAPTKITCIVVVDRGAWEAGLVVDEVTEVQHIAKTDPPEGITLPADDGTFIDGVGRVDRRMVLLLDLDGVMDTGREGETETASPPEYSMPEAA